MQNFNKILKFNKDFADREIKKEQDRRAERVRIRHMLAEQREADKIRKFKEEHMMTEFDKRYHAKVIKGKYKPPNGPLC